MSALIALALADAHLPGESDEAFVARLAGAVSIEAVKAGWPGARVIAMSWTKGKAGSLAVEPGPHAVTPADRPQWWADNAGQGRLL